MVRRSGRRARAEGSLVAPPDRGSVRLDARQAPTSVVDLGALHAVRPGRVLRERRGGLPLAQPAVVLSVRGLALVAATVKPVVGPAAPVLHHPPSKTTRRPRDSDRALARSRPRTHSGRSAEVCERPHPAGAG